MNKPKIVILGAGYGGMIVASRLQKSTVAKDAEITLVNRHDYHYQTTWLHEPAAGTMHHDKTRMKIDSVIDTKKVNFIKGDVKEIKKDEKKVVLDEMVLDYDYLVVGLGAIPETFGIPGVKEHAFAIRSVNSVRLIKEHIEYQFASYNKQAADQDGKLTFVIAGAGFTGIEFAGEMTERIPELCEYYDIPREKVRILSIEAAPTALPGFDEELVEYAMNVLESRGVEFKISMPIKEVTADSVILNDDTEIKTNTIVWTTGVRGNPVIEDSGFDSMRGRIKVEKDLRAPGYEDIFVIGDCALIINEETERPYPPTAQIAIQQGAACANNLKALVEGKKEMEQFTPDIKGTVASLGGKEAIGIVGTRKIYGNSASAVKKMIDNRYLFLLGGMPLVIKKGKLKMF
ncbi:NAD(P)/FAD-dependent oxidoreductase [Alkalicoccus halolimnae]|uniref:NAD(P)/FAD-dependent oxidoreductase n=1 Tax=Alkalicoccus halolimnae TaxID=1667239 RepID=A0A5C7FH07_9BACI|nr:NAD(P)/FAD-dependent oxidoreductase [Alkalicoccus halolimnae]TXF84260.1 NAD(P)/FAD-dependent oxidoreductase [Alkalicoccus halolimnae]